MANFPNSVTSFSAKQDGIGQIIAASHVNTIQDEVAAIEDGYLNGTARLNSSASTVATLSVAGGSTFAGNMAMASTGVQIGSSAVPVQKVWALEVAGGGGATTLLKANSGTDASAGATNVDTVAIAGLTAKDALLVMTDLASSSQATADVQLYNATDGVKICTVSGAGGIGIAGIRVGQARIRQAQSGATHVNALSMFMSAGTSVTGEGLQSTVTTAWTGSWTLALRHGGVTAGGTFLYSWSVYKVSGQ